ncbi:MAG: hypothetical protein M1840_008542 [Geoglossum simile]|nr:MAG: hypothetical protein M1840_008542 [Geoglossum simile]
MATFEDSKAKAKGQGFTGGTEKELLFWCAETKHYHFGWLSSLTQEERTAKLSETNDNYSTLLHIAAGNGGHDLVVWLVKNDVPGDTEDCVGRTPLSYAAAAGWKNIIVALPPFEVDRRDSENRTALMYAAMANARVTVKELLTRGADRTLRDKDDHTALQHSTDPSTRKLLK